MRWKRKRKKGTKRGKKSGELRERDRHPWVQGGGREFGNGYLVQTTSESCKQGDHRESPMLGRKGEMKKKRGKRKADPKTAGEKSLWAREGTCNRS